MKCSCHLLACLNLLMYFYFTGAFHTNFVVTNAMDFSGVVSIRQFIENQYGGYLKHKNIGVLIADRVVLTVASKNVWISSGKRTAYVYVSINGPGQEQMQQVIKIQSITQHPDFDLDNSGSTWNDYDVALLQLEEQPINVTSVLLAEFRDKKLLENSERKCVVVSYNVSGIRSEKDPARTVDSSNLRYSNVSWISAKRCKQMRRKDFDSERAFCSSFYENIQTNVLECEEDIGAPYLCPVNETWLSFGMLTVLSSKGKPRVYTSIIHDEIMLWIKAETKKIMETPQVSTSVLSANTSSQIQVLPCKVQEDKDIHSTGYLEPVHEKPFSACCSICKLTSGCKAYAWNDYKGGTCWLKRAATPVVEKKGIKIGILPSVVIRINTCETLENKDIDAEGSVVVHGQPFTACCTICHEISDCKAYSWNDYEGGTCWLKKGVGPIVEKQGVKVGFKPKTVQSETCEIQEEKDIEGGNLSSVSNEPLSDCCGLCQQHSECKGYAWNNYDGGTCWLKNSTGPVIETNGSMIGILQHLNTSESLICQTFENTEVRGTTIHTVKYQKLSECCDLCMKKPYCKAYTWTNAWGGSCHLKSYSGSDIQTKVGVHSGFVSSSSSDYPSDNIPDSPLIFSDIPLHGIAGGKKTNIKNFLWIISIKKRLSTGKLKHMCTGAIINETFVVTTAFCFATANKALVPDKFTLFHPSSGRYYKIKNIKMHESFDPDGGAFSRAHGGLNIAKLSHDIVLIQTVKQIRNGSTIQILQSSSGMGTYTDCAVLGWGRDYDNISIKYADVPLRNDEDCHIQWPGLDETMLCAGKSGKDKTDRTGACADAVGALLMCRFAHSWHLVGMSSFGTYKCLLKPTVFSNVEKLLPWIKNAAFILEGGRTSLQSSVGFIILLGIAAILMIACLGVTVAALYYKGYFIAVQMDLSRIDKDQIRMIEKIGEGHFGEVWKGEFTGKRNASQTVAIKVLKLTAQDKEKRQFLEEAFILGKLQGNRYITSAVGLCLDSRPNMLVLEFMNGGSLSQFLQDDQRRNNMKHKQLIRIAMDICKACCFMEEKGYIHRDIAARNCLVELRDPASNNLTITKLSDFGLAKDEKTIYMTPDPDLPVGWAAPEAFNGVFLIKSDVWAFGVLLWEIFSYAADPYGKCSKPREYHICPCTVYNHAQTMRHVCEKQKTLLDLSDPCTAQFTDFLKEILGKCWQYMPDMRPHFSTVSSLLLQAELRCDKLRFELEDDDTRNMQAQLASSSSSLKPTVKVSVSSSSSSDRLPQGNLNEYSKLMIQPSNNNSAEKIELSGAYK